MTSPPAIVGKVSWFGGPHDPGAQGTPASGIPITVPGIAVYNRATLGGFWRVRFPNGRVVTLRQTDLGPAPNTGRKVDVTYSALGAAGYTEQNFPTDSLVSAVYLGKSPQSALQPPGATQTPTAAPASGALIDQSKRAGALKALLTVALVAGGAGLIYLGVNTGTGGAAGHAVKRAAILGAAA